MIYHVHIILLLQYCNEVDLDPWTILHLSWISKIAALHTCPSTTRSLYNNVCPSIFLHRRYAGNPRMSTMVRNACMSLSEHTGNTIGPSEDVPYEQPLGSEYPSTPEILRRHRTIQGCPPMSNFITPCVWVSEYTRNTKIQSDHPRMSGMSIHLVLSIRVHRRYSDVIGLSKDLPPPPPPMSNPLCLSIRAHQEYPDTARFSEDAPYPDTVGLSEGVRHEQPPSYSCACLSICALTAYFSDLLQSNSEQDCYLTIITSSVTS